MRRIRRPGQTPTVLSERSRRRRREQLLRSLRPWASGVALVALVGFAIWAVAFSTWLAVSHVNVTGERVVSERAVLRAAKVPNGRPLVRVDLDAIRRRVEAIPAVEQATVRRSWPQGLRIIVAERVQVAVLRRAGRWYAVDRHGVVFRTLPRRTPGYPQIDVSRTSAQLVGDAADVAASIPPTFVRQVQTIRAHSADSIELVLARGRTVVWGSAHDSARKAQVAKVLLRTSARIYDVSVPELPATTQ
jgi:cell division protein FtsQ